MAIDHAVAAGFGRGEWGGMYSSIRTFTMIVAPLLYSKCDAVLRIRPPGNCFWAPKNDSLYEVAIQNISWTPRIAVSRPRIASAGATP
jgi:hypothetical protein